MLDAVGSYWKHIYSDKELLDRKENIINVKQLFEHFLEEKSIFENNNSTMTTFNNERLSDCLDCNDLKDSFIDRDYIAYIFRHLRAKLSSGLNNIPNIILKKMYPKQ